ncbi:MAG TPA: NYN domain-containing protein [Candidatus Limnocylindrales bacterium]|nr:NYN domain-containing protein [Candidatus Limnocylindrales bacterium]
MSKNVAVFVDVANIFYAAKAAGVDIDYVTLLKASSAGRDLVRAYAYTGLDPDNENQRNFHDFLRRHGYKVVSKDIRKYGDGKVKANLDIELVVDMMKTARNLDVAIVVSGDGDFAPAIRAVQEMGVRVEVVSFRGNTSSDLIDVADIFTDITQIAKVEKGSARSGRRVADDEEDLSMTEVPEKQSEGSGDGRRRGRGSRSRTGEASAPRTATSRATSTRTSTRGAAAREAAAREAVARDAVVVEGTLVALPGEKLARAARRAAAEPAPEEAGEAALELEREAVELVAEGPEGGAESPEGPDGGAEDQAGEDGHRRRRRRRGGRGRGRGRGREGEEAAGEVAPLGSAADDFEEPEPLPAPRRPAFSFGSVWGNQLGKAPAAASAESGGRAESGAREPVDEEDLEEPAIPEYLLAERRQRDAGAPHRPGRGGRGRGGAYAAALDRERFGGGRGSQVSRFAEPTQRHRDAGSGRVAGGRGPVSRGFERPEPRGSSSEPWSEVPPEIEAMLRAQMAGSSRAARPAPSRATRPPARGGVERPSREGGSGEIPRREVAGAETAGAAAATPSAATASRTRRPGRPAAHPKTAETGPTAADGASTAEPVRTTEPQATARPAARARRTTGQASAASAADSVPDGARAAAAPAGAPKRTRRSKPAEASAETASGDAPVTPRRRATRRKADTAD